MKKLFLFLAVLLATATSGCAIRVTPLGGIEQTRTSQEKWYSIVIDNQTTATATLIIDGDIRRFIPFSRVTKYKMNCGRFFIVKFDGGKSFRRQIFAGDGEIVAITISEDKKWKKRVSFERIRRTSNRWQRKKTDTRPYRWRGNGYRYYHR